MVIIGDVIFATAEILESMFELYVYSTEGGDYMYKNAKAEMVRQGLRLEDVAPGLDMTISTLSQKLNGKYPITLNEAKAFKKIVKTDLPLEVLFEEAV